MLPRYHLTQSEGNAIILQGRYSPNLASFGYPERITMVIPLEFGLRQRRHRPYYHPCTLA